MGARSDYKVLTRRTNCLLRSMTCIHNGIHAFKLLSRNKIFMSRPSEGVKPCVHYEVHTAFSVY